MCVTISRRRERLLTVIYTVLIVGTATDAIMCTMLCIYGGSLYRYDCGGYTL